MQSSDGNTSTPKELSPVCSSNMKSEKTSEVDCHLPTLSSTPQRKKRNLLANLYSSLSPKYIGFAPSSSNSSMVTPRSEERTRSSRRHHFNRSAELANSGSIKSNNDGVVVISPSTEVIGCLRRTQSFTSPIVSKEKQQSRKSFVSPIEKLLLKNGSVSPSSAILFQTCSVNISHDVSNTKTSDVKQLQYKETTRNEGDSKISSVIIVGDEKKSENDICIDRDKRENGSNNVLVKQELNTSFRSDDSHTVKADVLNVNQSNAQIESDGEDKSTLYSRHEEITANSPSALSIDSAKGSSVITGTSWTSFSTGDIFWGQIYSYCYWPCMVCPDPSGKTIATEKNGRNSYESVIVHVRFFADNGRRNWVKKENLIPYTGLESYKERVRDIRDKYGRRSTKYKLLVPRQSKKNVWLDAISEANMVAEVMYTERLEKFYEIFEKSRSSQKQDRKRRKSMITTQSSTSDIGSLRESLDAAPHLNNAPLVAVKRDRSASPFSPAYSPHKSTTMKRQKVGSNSATNVLTNIKYEKSCEEDEIESGSNYTSTMSSAAGGGSVVQHLEDSEMFNSSEFQKFYVTMRSFVMENNQDEQLERSLLVAVRNIWGLKQINRAQMQQRILENFNENELGSTRIERSGTQGEVGSIKRLSNRLKTLVVRRSITAASVPATLPDQQLQQQQQPESNVEEVKPKKSLNRPIEEVVDDIFDLDRKYLFKGLGRDPVCKYCFQPGGLLKKCTKSCQSWLHGDCNKNSSTLNNKKRALKKPKGSENRTLVVEKANVTQDVQPADIPKSEESIASSAHITAENEALEIVCRECELNEEPKCVVCNRHESPTTTNEQLLVCNTTHCNQSFHASCCRYWPQAKITKSKDTVESFRCPSHVCHTCVSDDPRGKFQNLSIAKLTKCMKCPASYHVDSTCIPAGTQVLTAAHIICPRHGGSKSDTAVNVNWCFICVGGGQVICCETCPTAVHARCLNIPLDPNEGYICEECESGRMPLYGEIVWAKFTSFRWWPSIILPPPEVPQNIMRKTHNASDFVVRFFGTHDHGWISRRRVYLYLEGDCSEPPKTKSYLDQSYNRGVEEAKRIYKLIKTRKQSLILTNEDKERLQPQPYVRIKANRAVPPVKLHIDMEKISKCECKANDENPCGPDSNCLNRVLYHECNPKLCPAGDRCQNQLFQSKVSPRLDVVYMKQRGFGLVSREPIGANSFVIEYVGEIIDDHEFRQRIAQKSNDRDENFYFLSIEKDYIIDAGPKGNLARFMNHSCDPNCETQKWSVNGLNRVGIFAIKDIPTNTELTFNYHWDDLLGNEKKTCFCGADKCTGQIGSKYKEEKSSKVVTNIDLRRKNSRGRPSTKKLLKPLKRLDRKTATTSKSLKIKIKSAIVATDVTKHKSKRKSDTDESESRGTVKSTSQNDDKSDIF